MATTTEADALERRVTDLYAKAVEQLGAEKAPVRFAHRTSFDNARFAAAADFDGVDFRPAGADKNADPGSSGYLDHIGFAGATFAEGAPPSVVPFLDRGNAGL